ncbi:acetoacetate decarboxylase family protein [Paenibacillus rhizoplanae]
MSVAGTETLTGTLRYNDVLVAVGTMPYKHNLLVTEDTARAIAKTQVNLKLIPDVDGTPKIAQLVAYTLEDVHVKRRLDRAGPLKPDPPHVNAPVADLPVKAYLGGKHFIADLTLPYGQVIHDYIQ